MKKSIISMTLAAVMMTSASAYAMSFEQVGDKTVRLQGNVGANGERVALDVFADGKTRADLATVKENGGEYTDIWVTHLQTTSDENGDYTFEFDIALPSGKYTAFTGIKGSEFEPYDFTFVSNSDFVSLAEEINTADVGRISEIIRDKNDCYVLGISEEEAAAMDVEKLAKVIKNTLSQTPFIKEDRVKSWLITHRAYYTEQLNENKAADIYEVDENITDFANSDIAEFYKKDSLSTAFTADFTKRMSGKNFDSYSAYKAALPEAFVLATVQNPSGPAEVEKVVTAFQDKIGITVSSSTPSTVWNKLSGKNYDNFAALKEAFNTYVNEGSSIISGGSSSGSWGSSSGGGSGSSKPSSSISSTVSVPVNNGATANTPLPVDIFDDISDVEWAKDAIVALAEKNIVSGVAEGKFNPNGNVTREQFVKIVVGAFVPDAESGDISFGDVAKDAWYAEYIAKAYSKGIVGGIGNGLFGVGMNITRQDMCVMIYNAAKASGMSFDTSDETFADDSSIADYAKEAVYALKKAGAVNGISDDEFGPFAFATRAQAAKIIYSLIK